MEYEFASTVDKNLRPYYRRRQKENARHEGLCGNGGLQ